MSIWGENSSSDLDDFSPSSTVVFFDPPIPLLRGPVPAALSDDTRAGLFVLAFNSASSWRSAFESTQSKLIDQCLDGARAGCAISASIKCKPPWWKSLFGVSAGDYAERERCEEREMALCIAASKEPCVKFAKEKCLPAFRDARIASTKWKGASHLVFAAFQDDADAYQNPVDAFEAKAGKRELERDVEITTFRGSDLLDNPSDATCSP